MRLGAVSGQFVESGEGFAFAPTAPADRALIDSTIALDTAVVPLLIDCLADSTGARAVYHGPIFETIITPPVIYRDLPVSKGAVCFWVFLRTKWFQRQMQEHHYDPDFREDKGVDYHRIDGAAQLRARDAWSAYLALHPLPHAWPVP